MLILGLDNAGKVSVAHSEIAIGVEYDFESCPAVADLGGDCCRTAA